MTFVKNRNIKDTNTTKKFDMHHTQYFSFFYEWWQLPAYLCMARLNFFCLRRRHIQKSTKQTESITRRDPCRRPRNFERTMVCYQANVSQGKQRDTCCHCLDKIEHNVFCSSCILRAHSRFEQNSEAVNQRNEMISQMDCWMITAVWNGWDICQTDKIRMIILWLATHGQSILDLPQ